RSQNSDAPSALTSCALASSHSNVSQLECLRFNASSSACELFISLRGLRENLQSDSNYRCIHHPFVFRFAAEPNANRHSTSTARRQRHCRVESRASNRRH